QLIEHLRENGTPSSYPRRKRPPRSKKLFPPSLTVSAQEVTYDVYINSLRHDAVVRDPSCPPGGGRGQVGARPPVRSCLRLDASLRSRSLSGRNRCLASLVPACTRRTSRAATSRTRSGRS